MYLGAIRIYDPQSYHNMASSDFVVLSLDGSRQVEERLEEGKPATALSRSRSLHWQASHSTI